MSQNENKSQDEDKRVVLEDITGLHEKFYKIFADLYEQRRTMEPEVYLGMVKNMFAQYGIEYALKAKAKAILDKDELYRLDAKDAALVPRKVWSLFNNRAAKMTLTEVSGETHNKFENREFSLEVNYPHVWKTSRVGKRAERKRKKAKRKEAKAEKKAAKREAKKAAKKQKEEQKTAK